MLLRDWAERVSGNWKLQSVVIENSFLVQDGAWQSFYRGRTMTKRWFQSHSRKQICHRRFMVSLTNHSIQYPQKFFLKLLYVLSQAVRESPDSWIWWTGTTSHCKHGEIWNGNSQYLVLRQNQRFDPYSKALFFVLLCGRSKRACRDHQHFLAPDFFLKTFILHDELVSPVMKRTSSQTGRHFSCRTMLLIGFRNKYLRHLLEVGWGEKW